MLLDLLGVLRQVLGSWDRNNTPFVEVLVPSAYGEITAQLLLNTMGWLLSKRTFQIPVNICSIFCSELGGWERAGSEDLEKEEGSPELDFGEGRQASQHTL